MFSKVQNVKCINNIIPVVNFVSEGEKLKQNLETLLILLTGG